MFGVIVNTFAVIIGSFIGLIFKKGISEKIASAVMTGIGLCSLYLGVSNALVDGNDALVAILSIVIGAVIGTLLDLDGKINKLGDWVSARYSKETEGKISVAEGFVTACLLFCIGAMTIAGSIQAGLGDNTTLYTKSVLDFISAIMLSVSLGIGVIFSSAFVLIFQGAIALLAGVIEPILNAKGMLQSIICVGGILIIGLGLNILGITKIKVANYLPALIVAPLVCWLLSLIETYNLLEKICS
ncbi:MAG: DUF554 domain-containing protein [Bacillota bacterium]|nr:DUF554 domain-containing protein [Bacillota bacterium]